jgi:dienelactone hydrolase
VDTGRVRDVAAVARWLKQETGRPIVAAGRSAAGLVAAYAAVLEPDIESAIAIEPPPTHMDAASPQFLNILRVCDVPEMLGLLAPRSLTVVSRDEKAWRRVAECYKAGGVYDRFSRISPADE